MPTRRLTWTAYLFMAAEGYLIYAVGFITPYLQADLDVPPWLAALPNSLMALGIIWSGIVVKPVLARLGPTVTIRLWAALMAVAAVLLALPLTILPVLAGAFLFGVAAAGLMVHVNSGLSPFRGGVLVVRANLWSVAGGVAGPLALALAARTIGWSVGALVPVPLLLVLALVLPGSPARDAPVDGRREPPLGRPYWMTWAFLVLCIGAEFSFVAWGAQVAVARTGIAMADATALASLYVVGMVAGRAALSTGVMRAPWIPLLLRGCALLGAVGAVVLWVAGIPAAAGLGLFLGGLGISAIYPFGATLAISQAPLAPVRASARLTAASGVAILAAPLLLGLVAGVTGVTGAWTMVLAFLIAGLVVLWLTPRPPSPAVAIAAPGSTPDPSAPLDTTPAPV